MAGRFLRQRFFSYALLPAIFLFSPIRSGAQSEIPYYPYYPSQPLFEYAVFYNLNLEIDPGAAFPINAPVFSNAGIWSGTPNVVYDSTVWAVGQVNTSDTDPYLSGKTDSGTPAGNFIYPGQPVSGVAPVLFETFGTNNLHAMLDLPPANVAAPQAIAYIASNQVYCFNAASLIISNAAGGTNSTTPTGGPITIHAQDKNPTGLSFHWPATGRWTAVTNDFYVVTNSKSQTFVTSNLLTITGFTAANFPPFPWTGSPPIIWQTGTTTKTNWGVQYAGWSFLTNVSFYDYRESDTVQAVQIDIAKFRTWLTNSGVNGGSNWNYALNFDDGEGIDSIYVYNSVPLTTSTLPAVRLVNGLRLPNTTNIVAGWNYITSGLTVATPQPLYVLGDYNTMIDGDITEVSANTGNTSHTYPAAFMADAITVLSGNWNDSYTSATSLASRTPKNTTINAACIAGIVPSSDIHPSGGGYVGYSGGSIQTSRL